MRFPLSYRVIALILAVLWLPAVWHCELETLQTAGSSERCCSHDDSEGPAGGTCLSDPCAIFDEGHVRAGDEGGSAIVAPAMALLALIEDLRVIDAAVTLRAGNPPPDPVPDAKAWAFVRRHAALANAPGHAVS